MTRVAAGIVTFNRASMLRTALDAMLAQTRPLDKIFVVDNASTDETPAVVKSYQVRFPGKIEHVRNADNEGSAGGFYMAAKSGYDSGADWVWLTDDDAIPEPTTLERLLASKAAQDSQTGGLGCAVIDDDRLVFPSNLQCKIDKSSFSFKPIEFTSLESTEPIASDTNSFDGFLVHRRAIGKVGFPQRDYFIWWDDIEYSLRISREFKLWVVPNATILHKAKARSTEQRHAFFKALVQVYDWEGCWRMYYRSRNYYALARRYSSVSHFHKMFVKNAVKEVLIPVLFKQDHLKERVKLALRAAWDGYFGNLGKTIEISPPFNKRK